MGKVLKKTRWLGLEFFTNDAHADATLRILKRRLKWRRKTAEKLVCVCVWVRGKNNTVTAAAREVAKQKTVFVVVSLSYDDRINNDPLRVVIYSREQCVCWT